MKKLGKRLNNWLNEPMFKPETCRSISTWLNEPVIKTETIHKIKVFMIPEVNEETKDEKANTPIEETSKSPKMIRLDEIKYCVLSIEPSKLTSNTGVKWLLTEVARIYTPMIERISAHWDGISYLPSLSVWWEVYVSKTAIRFYLVVPEISNTVDVLARQAMKTWKQSNVRKVEDYMPELNPEDTSVTVLTLENHSVLSLDSSNPRCSPLEGVLNCKNYLEDKDIALLQIGIQPLGEAWNGESLSIFNEIKETGVVPSKGLKEINGKMIAEKIGMGIGLVAEELVNILGDFVIPGWEDNRQLLESTKISLKEGDGICTKAKIRSEGFKTSIRIIACSESEERRTAIVRCISSGFDPLEADNKLVEKQLSPRKVERIIPKIIQRKHEVYNKDVLCSLELAKIINVPDQKAQIENYNELSFNTTRSESAVPDKIFEDDGEGLPFAVYETNDGDKKQVYFEGKDKDRLCMPKVIMGEPGCGKTTEAISLSLDAFMKGYGVFTIDAADGKMVQRILDCVPPEKRDKVKILDLLNMKFPVGIGWNEAFRNDPDVVEDLLVDEVIGYIELVSGEKLNMRSKQWVENAVKAVFVTPDATLIDVECMLNNAQYRNKVIPTIEDPQLRARWEYYHNELSANDRKLIYEEAFRRIGIVMDKKALKNFILQKPKSDGKGNYLFDIRKWMDEGYLVLVKANESLGTTLQTALVSFLIAKFNLAMISREDIDNENDRHPCFLILDEPDHYIKGSERWKSMLTRYRKYRCGLTFMFHGWQQLAETDRNLPKIIRKSGAHYMIYHTDLENMLEVKSMIEPEFKVSELVNGMPSHYAVVKLNMFNDKGQPLPAFMAKGMDVVAKRYKTYDNNDLYEKCALELGRPKKEVMDEIFYYRNKGSEFDQLKLSTPVSTLGEGDLDDGTDIDVLNKATTDKARDEEEELLNKQEQNRKTKMVLEYEVESYIKNCEEKGEEVDLEIIQHLDELLEEDNTTLEEG